jgi:hypothetical protein
VTCGKPIPPGRKEACSLDEGCCPDCFAACEKLDRCAKLPSGEFWEKVDHVRRMVWDTGYPPKGH